MPGGPISPQTLGSGRPPDRLMVPTLGLRERSVLVGPSSAFACWLDAVDVAFSDNNPPLLPCRVPHSLADT